MKFKENIQLGQPLLFLFSTLHGTRITKISTLFSGQNLLWCILHGRSPKINPVDSKCDLKCVRVKTAPQTISSCLETLNLLDNVLQFPSECESAFKGECRSTELLQCDSPVKCLLT